MKWNKDKVIIVLIGCITVWFTITKIQDASFIRNQYSAVSVRLKTEGITEKSLNIRPEADKAGESSGLREITAWMRIADGEVKNKDLNRTQKIPVIIAAGNMALTVPMVLVSGNYVYREDKKGCVLDTGTAYALFGTEHAVSNTVTYEKKSYIIRGIVKTDSPVFLIQGDNDRKEYFNLELAYKEEERGEALTEEFLLQNGLAADSVIIDGYFFGRLIHSLITLPIWSFFFFAAYGILNYYKRNRGKLSLKTFVLYGSLIIFLLTGCGILLYQITGNPVYIPEKLVPTKWSDFDYWPQKYQSMKNQLRQIRYLIPNPKDVYLMDEISKIYHNIAIMITLHMLLFLRIHLFKK